MGEKAIKAVLSDLGNVVAMYSPGTYIGHFSRLPEVEKVLPKIQLELDVMEADLWKIQARCEVGELSEFQYRQEVSARIGMDRVIPIKVMYQNFYDTFTLNKEVHELWSRLSVERDITMVAVSNLCLGHYITMRGIGALKPFDHEILSFEEGLRKPSEELMIRALDRAGVMAEEAVFIDDCPKNLIPAINLGIDVHCYRSFPGLLDFLRQHGLTHNLT